MAFSLKTILNRAGNCCKRYPNTTQMSSRKLKMCGTEEEMRVVAARICRNYLTGMWKHVEPPQLDFRRISGGLSNFLYYVALPEDVSQLQLLGAPADDGGEDSRGDLMDHGEPRKVLLRIYGQVHGERAMDAIVTESVIFTLLSERRLGPRLHGVFSGGRIEEYLPARPLLTKELSDPSFSMKIAQKMAAIHSMDVPLSKGPHWLWKTMGKWLKTATAERLSGTTAAKNKTEEAIIKRLQNVDFEKEIEWIKKFIATVDSPVVFCHNDMQEGNILLLEDPVSAHSPQYEQPDPEYCPSFVSPACMKGTAYAPLVEDANTRDSISSRISDSGEPRLVLIDFEYCAYNYRGFDIANHFQEWCYDYTNPVHPFYYEKQENTPTLEQKEIFIREYLKHYQTNCQSGFDSPRDHQEEPSIDAVNKLLDEVESFTVVVHIFWALWSLVNASKSQIPFGYWEFAMARLDTYLELKQEVIKKDKYGLPQKRKICEVDI